MPLVMLFAFPAIAGGLLWLIGETGIEDDAGWTVLVAFGAAVLICASAGNWWEQRRKEKSYRRI